MTETPDPAPAPSRFGGLLSGGRTGLAALAVSVLALIIALAPYATGTDFGSRVRTYLIQNPEVLQEVSDALNQKAQQQQIVDSRQKAAEITARVAANPGLLAVDSRDAAFGPADAKVTVIEYFDFRCPGCKATAPEVLRIMQAHPDVRFVFKEWPILDGPTNGVSHYAARAAQAAHRQGKYLPVFRALMAEPALSEPAVDAILQANGVSMPQAETAMAGSEIASHLADMQTSAMAMGLVGTPTFFVNGKAMESIEPAALESEIREAKAR
ncbi:MAG: thioredoxin domain-containing protein [Brevundimonas sp.]|uniref:DsbA family protein n=1 Tax=Brevundimonas sp. TaxID=1871086 RepID=UPI00263A27EA|nr:thioredoxin domain-containing protein [Brevundimonas sp.]MDI6625370.1 thioredoxin domain-containing protein [Brevundimonas sp.]MDQ7811750.1 thioredoxin domain-containing protein [Brevundimonas sp.]